MPWYAANAWLFPFLCLAVSFLVHGCSLPYAWLFLFLEPGCFLPCAWLVVPSRVPNIRFNVAKMLQSFVPIVEPTVRRLTPALLLVVFCSTVQYTVDNH